MSTATNEHAKAMRHVKCRTSYSALFFVLCLALISGIGSTGLLAEYGFLAWVFCLVTSTYAVYVSRRLIPLTLPFLFNLLFVAYAIPHFFFEIDIGFLPIATGEKYLAQAMWLISLFSSIVLIWISRIGEQGEGRRSFVDIRDAMRPPRSSFVFYSLAIIWMASIIFGIQGGNVLGADGGYGIYLENLGLNSGLPEYLLVIVLLSGLFIRTRMQQLIWYLVLIVFVLKLSMVGLRVVALMAIICGLWFLPVKYNLKKVLIVFFSGFVFFSLLGLLKGQAINWSSFLAAMLFEIHGDTLVSHHSNVLWASSQMLLLIDEGVLGIDKRIELLTYYLANILVPSSIIQSALGEPYLGTWLQQQGYSSGGGHVAVYSYVAGGIPGVVLVASVVGYGIRTLLSVRRGWLANFIRIWMMVVLITFPRWISYDLGNFLFRLPVYAAIIYTLLLMISATKARKKYVEAPAN